MGISQSDASTGAEPPEVAAVQAYAEACVFPSMDLAKQRLVVVPGAAQSTYSDARLF